MPFFTKEEQESRIRNFRNELRKRKVDCAVLFSFHNSYYLSGVPIDPWGNYCPVIIPVEGDATLIVPFIDKERAEENSWINDVRVYTHDMEHPLTQVLKLTKEALLEKGLDRRTIGLELANEEDRLSYPIYVALGNQLANAQFVDVSKVLEDMRLVLSTEEFENLRIAGEIGVVGMKAFVSAVMEGASERELALEAHVAMEKEIARKYPRVETIVGGRSYFRCMFGKKTLHVHGGGTGASRLNRGDIIQGNAIPFINGYMCSLERTMIFGKPSEKQTEAFDVMLKAREKGIEMFKPGVKCSDVYKVCVDALKKSGHDKYIRHGFGHAHGILSWHCGWLRKGLISPWDNTLLRKGMVVSMLLGIYLPELGGFRHGDMFLITEDGHTNLTPYDRGLLTIQE